MLSFLLNLIGTRKPVPFDIHDFCEKVFNEVQEYPSHDVGVTEIRHFKERDNMEHEFLLADITDAHGQKQCTLRLERSAATHQRTSFFQKLVGVSSCVFPAKDTIWIASSDTQLTDGMERGPSFPVARLPFSRKPFSLRELCLILSFFPAFSPSYKLREEQCYWFCDVVLKTTLVADEGVSIVEEKSFKKAGRFGRVSVKLSTSARQLFIDAYMAVRTLGENPGSNAALPKLPPLQAMPLLSALLDVPSTEARIRAIDTITTLAKSSSEHRCRLVRSQAAQKLVRIINTFPLMKVPATTAFQALVGAWWPKYLDVVSVDAKIAYLSLASPDPGICLEAVDGHISTLLSSNCPTSVLAFIQSGKNSVIQTSAVTAIQSHLKDTKSSANPDWFVTLSNAVSSPLYSPRMKRRIADFLATIIRHRTPNEDTLLRANIKAMLTSKFEGLETLIIDVLCTKFPSGEVFWQQLVSAGCLPILEQHTLARPHDDKVLYSFAGVCERFKGIPPYDPCLPEHLIQRLRQGPRTSRDNTLVIIEKLASSQDFSEEICDRGAPRILAGLGEGVSGGNVAVGLCSLSRWSSCRRVLLDAGLIPSGNRSYFSQEGHGVVIAYLRDRFLRWNWSTSY